MSNLDFLSVTLGKYINDNLKFVEKAGNPPGIFFVNYFLKDKGGEYLTGMHDKHVWVKWIELRVNGNIDAIKTPIGYIPEYKDLKKIFHEILNKEYSEKDYIRQFTLRIPENLAKTERIVNIYKKDALDAPRVLFDALEVQKKRLLDAQTKYGDYISPSTT